MRAPVQSTSVEQMDSGRMVKIETAKRWRMWELGHVTVISKGNYKFTSKLSVKSVGMRIPWPQNC